MAMSSRDRKRTAGQGWLTTVLGILVLVAGGFSLGLVVGIVSEEPELVVGHVAGRSTEIDWSADALEAPAPTAVEPEQDFGQHLAAADAEPAARPAAAAQHARPAPSHRGKSNAKAEAHATLPPVAAPPKARPASPTVSTGSLHFAIQVGAFGESASAEKVAGRLRKGGYPVQVLAPSSDDRWRVRVGPIGSKAEAEQMARRLKVEESLPTWVLRESGT